MEKETVGSTIKRMKGAPKRNESPGNPRYQPQALVPFSGYDNLVKFLIEVEFALWKVLAKLGFLPPEAITLLTVELKDKLYEEITTSLQDQVERKITKHDVRALVVIILELVDKKLARWAHIPATSYDVIDTARIIAYKRAFWQVTFPTLLKLVSILREKVVGFADTVQIGRTHGQHAEPITVGFWLATVLQRLVDVIEHLIEGETELVGKFSGPVGAYNCQVGLGFEEKAKAMSGKTFEELVLEEVGLSPAPISTQILPPEPLARFLFEYTLLSGVLAQLALDVRQLQRAEIGEVGEPYDPTQVGSSAMPHKRNPKTFEHIQGMFLNIKWEFGKALETLYSEHQRDLITTPVMREFLGIVVFVQDQLDNLLRVFPKLSVDRAALERNFNMNRHLILSEAVYIALVMAGYEGDAHDLVNHTLVPRAQKSGCHIISELQFLSQEKPELRLQPVIDRIPKDLIELLEAPEKFTGKAKEKALEIAENAKKLLDKYQ
jgi:adenylosuccinate lyase